MAYTTEDLPPLHYDTNNDTSAILQHDEEDDDNSNSGRRDGPNWLNSAILHQSNNFLNLREPPPVAEGELEEVTWRNAKWKGEIVAHPLYEQLLSAHVACLRIATPVDQLPRIDAQLAQAQRVVAKYSGLTGGGNGQSQGMVEDKEELDQFMV